MTPQYKTIVDTHKFNKITAIAIGVALSVPLLFVSFMMFQNVLTRASSSVPRDVVITKITETAATITWTTDQKTTGVVEYGTAPNALVFFAPVTGEPSTDHTIELNLLTPKTAHYFQIRINGEIQDNGGVPWTFTTRGNDTSTSSEPTATPSATISQTVKPTGATISGPTVTKAPASAACTETDCQMIRAKFGAGCSVSDYIRCIQKITGTPTVTPGPTSASTTATSTPVPNNAPTVSGLTSPSAGVGGTQPTLSFTIADSNAGDTVKFQIQIDNDQDFGSPVIDYTSGLGGTGTASFKVGQNAGNGAYNGHGTAGQGLVADDYFWRVKVIDSKGAASSFNPANGGNVAFTIN